MGIQGGLVGLGQLNSRRENYPYLHIGSGEHDKTENVAEDPNGNDEEGHIVGNKLYLLHSLTHCGRTEQLSENDAHYTVFLIRRIQ